MANITEFGYDVFLNKPTSSIPQLDTDLVDAFLDNISGNKISSGISQSANSKMAVDFNEGIIQFKEGDSVRAELGKFVDEKIGLRVYDSGGNTVVDSTA